MIQVNRIYLIFNRLVTKKFLVDTSEISYQKNWMILFGKLIYQEEENQLYIQNFMNCLVL